MAKTKAQKQAAFEELVIRIRKAKSAVFSTFANLDIKKQEELRGQFRACGVGFNVFKKTLVKKALEAENINSESMDQWRGNVGVATSSEEIAPAKILMSVARKEEGITVRFGILEGKRIEEDAVKELGAILSKEQLLASIVGSLQSPLYGLASVLHGIERNFVYILQQIKHTKE